MARPGTITFVQARPSLPVILNYALWISFLLKLGLAAWLPMSGDEAYFLVWAQHLDYGYYDHPPMVGWWLAPMLDTGHAVWWLRLPAVASTTLIGWLIYRLIAPIDETRATWAAMLYLVWPFTLADVLITTDTPLILFTFLTVYAMAQALRTSRQNHFARAGFWFGCALLSKYFAVVLGGALAGWFIATRTGRSHWRGAIIMLLCSLPLVAINLYWNYTHCWDNILFNLYNRNTGARFSWHDVGLYLITTLYLMTPPGAWMWWRSRQQHNPEHNPEHNPVTLSVDTLYRWVFWFPFVFFLALSFKKTIGLHWVLGFYPFFFLLLGLSASQYDLKKLFRFMCGFSALHAIIISALLMAPSNWWQRSHLYSGYILLMHPHQVLQALAPWQKNRIMATNDYSTSAILQYHARQPFIVYGMGSKHARQNDIITDFRRLDGKNLLIFDKSPTRASDYTPYFSSVTHLTIQVDKATFYVALGNQFNYATYQQHVLTDIRDRYYRIPQYLPHTPCYFCTRYFPDANSRFQP